MSCSKLCWRQTLLALALGGFFAAASESNAGVFATLKLVETLDDPFIQFAYDGPVDVYHVVATDVDEPVIALRVDFPHPTLSTSDNAELIVSDSTDFPFSAATPSFLVGPDSDAIPFFLPTNRAEGVFPIDGALSLTTLEGFVAMSGGDVLLSPGSDDTTIAVLGVPAGQRPDYGQFQALAYRPVYGSADPPGDIRGDLNGDGFFDLLDLEVFGSQFPGFEDENGDGVRDDADSAIFVNEFASSVGLLDAIAEEVVFLPELAADFNFDGVVNLLDLDILGKNFGKPGDFRDGDANGDGVVDLLDLDILGDPQFSTPAATSVPEPTALTLLALAASGGFAHQKR